MLGRKFVERYYNLSREKNSFLCVGLDPVTKDIRENYVVPPKLINKNPRTVKGIIRADCLT